MLYRNDRVGISVVLPASLSIVTLHSDGRPTHMYSCVSGSAFLFEGKGVHWLFGQPTQISGRSLDAGFSRSDERYGGHTCALGFLGHTYISVWRNHIFGGQVLATFGFVVTTRNGSLPQLEMGLAPTRNGSLSRCVTLPVPGRQVGCRRLRFDCQNWHF